MYHDDFLKWLVTLLITIPSEIHEKEGVRELLKSSLNKTQQANSALQVKYCCLV